MLTLLLTLFVSGSILAQLCLTRGHLQKVSSDVWKQRDWPGLAFTSNGNMYASGPWFIYKWEVTLKLFIDPIFF